AGGGDGVGVVVAEGRPLDEQARVEVDRGAYAVQVGDGDEAGAFGPPVDGDAGDAGAGGDGGDGESCCGDFCAELLGDGVAVCGGVSAIHVDEHTVRTGCVSDPF